MKADWKDATKEFPEKRIRVLTCDKLGLIRTGFYGRESWIGGSEIECWRSDEINNEKEIEATFWDYFPKTPYIDKDIF